MSEGGKGREGGGIERGRVAGEEGGKEGGNGGGREAEGREIRAGQKRQ